MRNQSSLEVRSLKKSQEIQESQIPSSQQCDCVLCLIMKFQILAPRKPINRNDSPPFLMGDFQFLNEGIFGTSGEISCLWDFLLYALGPCSIRLNFESHTSSNEFMRHYWKLPI